MSTLKGAFKFGGGGLFVLLLITAYSILNFSGGLFDFLNSYSKISKQDLAVTFYVPLFAICISYLSVLLKRAACLYFAPNLKETVSTKTTVEILLMVCIILMCASELVDCIPMATSQRTDALAVFLCVIIIGSGIQIGRKKRVPFTEDIVEVEFSDWYPARKYTCILPTMIFKRIVFCISQSYYFIACVIFTAVLMLH